MQVVAKKDIEKVPSPKEQNKTWLEKLCNNTYVAKLWNGHQISKRSALIGIGITTLLAITTIFTWRAYIRYQNGKIENLDCHFGENINGMIRDFNYYNNVAENKGQAYEQYCLAEIFRTGKGTLPSLENARNWYKKAADQGLTLAQKALCQPSMFQETNKDFREFEPLCCPNQGDLGLWIP